MVLAAEASFPLLTAAILLPLTGAVAVSLVSKRRPELLRLVALLFSGSAGAFTIWMLAAFDRNQSGFQFESTHQWIQEFGISWHLGVDGISLFLVVLTGVLFPITFVAVTPEKGPEAVLRLAPPARGGMHRCVHLARSVPLLRLLRDRPRPDVLPHRWLGLQRTGLRRAEVLPVHHVRFRADAGGHPVAGLRRARPGQQPARPRPPGAGRPPVRRPEPDPGRHRTRPGRARPDRRAEHAARRRRPAHLRSRRHRPGPGRAPQGRADRDRVGAGPGRSRRQLVEPVPLGCGQVDLPRLRPRLRGEGAAVPAAHVATGCPHAGAHRRVGHPGRRHAQARHVRLPALRPLPVPRCHRLLRARVPHPRRDRHHLRRPSWPRCRRA